MDGYEVMARQWISEQYGCRPPEDPQALFPAILTVSRVAELLRSLDREAVRSERAADAKIERLRSELRREIPVPRGEYVGLRELERVVRVALERGGHLSEDLAYAAGAALAAVDESRRLDDED